MTIKSRLLSILFWSVIAAAFIGPGTVTTAASSGTAYGYALLWALVFSIIACLVLQEVSSRLTIVSGKNLGQALQSQYSLHPSTKFIPYIVMGAIVFGCAAYEAGNILGAVAGLKLLLNIPGTILTLIIGFTAAFVLWRGSTKTVVRILGFIVAVMGFSFLTTAILLKPPIIEVTRSAFIPTFPVKSGLLILALIGTTVVPYNLFLGSGIAKGHNLKEMRFGLTVAVILGGIISMGILIVGSAIAGAFSYEALSDTLDQKLGTGTGWLLGIGLFSAGLSSAMTAPLAAAITTRSVFGYRKDHLWNEGLPRYRLVWGIVLLTGVIFGLTEIQPIPAIILAQALNGIVLPYVAVYLFIAVNDKTLMGEEHLNRGLKNIIMGVVVFITIILGVTNIARAIANATHISLPDERMLLFISFAIASFIAIPVWRVIKRRRWRHSVR